MNTVTHISKRGGKRVGAGRKRLEPTISKSIRLKLSLWEKIEQEAQLAGMNLTAYVVLKLGGDVQEVAQEAKEVSTQPPLKAIQADVPTPSPVIAPSAIVEVPPLTQRQAFEKGLSAQQAATLTGSTLSIVRKYQMLFASGNAEVISKVESGTDTIEQGLRALKGARKQVAQK